MGAFAQGGDLSPLGWVYLMDWKLAVCSRCSVRPYTVVNTRHDMVALSRAIFADDGTYLQGAKVCSGKEWRRALSRSFGATGAAIAKVVKTKASHMQTLVDGVELFCGLTGHEIKTKKSHALILCWLDD